MSTLTHHSLLRGMTTDTHLSNLLHVALPAQLYPSAAVPAASAVAAAPASFPLDSIVATTVDTQTTKLQRTAQRAAADEAFLQPELLEPTEDDIEQLEVEQMIASSALDKARTRFRAKAQLHESLRLRLIRAQQTFNAKKAARMKVMMEKRNALQRQTSEE